MSEKIIASTEEYISNHYREKVPAIYVYHNLQHTKDVVQACKDIAMGFGLTDEETEMLVLAAWFHDSGYDKGPDQHEERSCEYAGKWLSELGYSAKAIEIIQGCIRATKVPQSPDGVLQSIICDADLSHLGEKSYWDRTSRVRQEFVTVKNMVMGDKEWVDFELDFMLKHQFHTDIAKDLYNKRKLKNIIQLRKQKLRLNPEEVYTIDDVIVKEKNTKDIKGGDDDDEANQKIKKSQLSRGVETMYKTTYNTHNNLSSLADHKANLMLSVNTIVLSVVVSHLVPYLKTNKIFIFPAAILLITSITCIVYATLSTRPKITEGKFSLDDIRLKRANLLFFGNFYKMKLDDFHYGMMQMIKDREFLYSSMTKDIYYLGVVLAKKYRYLSICYSVFMYGMIASVFAFALCFIF